MNQNHQKKPADAGADEITKGSCIGFRYCTGAAEANGGAVEVIA